MRLIVAWFSNLTVAQGGARTRGDLHEFAAGNSRRLLSNLEMDYSDFLW